MYLNPERKKPRKRDKLFGYVKRLKNFHNHSPDHDGPSTSSQSLVQAMNLDVQVHASRDNPLSASTINAPVDREAGDVTFANDDSHDPHSAIPRSSAHRAQLDSEYSDLGSHNSPDHLPSPINVPVEHQTTEDTGKSIKGEIAMVAVKESLKLVKNFSDSFPPLKMVAGALLEIFDRIDTVKGVQKEAVQLREQVEKLARMLETYEDQENLKDRLDGLHRALEEKKAALENKLDRKLATRIVFSTEDSKFLVQVLREIKFSIEVTTLDMTLRNNREISGVHNKISWIKDKVSWMKDNTVLDKLRHVVGAEFNREGRQGCTQGTRVSLLADLLSWATMGDSSHVFWLDGMAGTGKTTLTETLCFVLNKKGILGASFFCSIKSKTPRRDVHAIFPSIAKTLAGNQPRFRENLVDVLATCSDPLGMDLEDQYRTLIFDPAEAAFRKDEIIVICIDALDECEEQEGTEKLLKAILNCKPSVPLRFFVTSRPERRIREAFRRQHYLSLRLHDIEDHVVKADIALYLSDQLRGIQKLKERYGNSWPPREIEIIVERAGKLFVYASTISKYIADRGDPCERLRKVSGLHSPVTVAVQSIDELYKFILSEAFIALDEEEASRIWSCLSILVSTQQPLSVSTYAMILGTKTDLIRTALESLHSILIIPDADDQPISLYHASFPDYLATRAEIKLAHRRNATRCFSFMDSELHLGISGATTSHQSNDDQPQPLLVPTHLKYTCTAWGYLVLQLVGPDNLIVEDIQTKIDSFLRSKFLYWLEVLSAMDDVPYAPRLLYQLSHKIPASHPLKLILSDCVEFTNRFMDPIRTCAPHIYLSALPFTAPSSMVSQLFLPKFPSLPVIHRSTDNTHAQHSIFLFEGHKDQVNCVAFSPDGKHIVSASNDHTVRLWNVETGEEACKSSDGHNEEVFSVAFSPDGKHIASSSSYTIRLWNIETGEATSKHFEGEILNCATSVSFTSDGKYITSLSKNHGIQLCQWNIGTGGMELISLELGITNDDGITDGDDITDDDDDITDDDVIYAFSPDGKYMVYAMRCGSHFQLLDVKTGAALKLFEGHASAVSSLSFSLDGKYIVSGSYDRTIRLWNIETGEMALKPIKGHKDRIWSVTFSTDGKCIVSGSHDRTVRLWDVKTGEALMKPFEGHNGGVTSASFSPDGKYIVSGSWDHTIRLWNFDSETDKTALRPSEGHTDTITSFSFSPDGSHIASGSEDCTIRVWDFKTGELALKPFVDHTDAVTSISFSPDGNYIASGSYDRTIRLWDAKTGEVVFTLFEEHTVNSISFSPDGKHIAVGSAHDTIQLCNVSTGETTKSKPFGMWPRTISFSPDGKYISACNKSDGTVALWNVETSEITPFNTLKENDKDSVGRVRQLAFSPDGKRIAVGLLSGIVQLWNVKTGKLEAASDPSQLEYTIPITCLAFSPDGKYIISGSFKVQLWTIEMDRLVSKSLKGHQSIVHSVSFSPDGKYIACGSYDRTIRIYNHDSAEQMDYGLRVAQATFLHQYPIESVRAASFPWLKYASGELMLWVPPELHLGLFMPRIVNIMGTDHIKIELSQFVDGTEWLKCQEPTRRREACN